MFLSQAEMRPGTFEYESFRVLSARNTRSKGLIGSVCARNFRHGTRTNFTDGFYDPEGGYAESGHVVAALLKRATTLGVAIREKSQFAQLDEGENGVEGAVLTDGTRLKADKVIMAAGAWTSSRSAARTSANLLRRCFSIHRVKPSGTYGGTVDVVVAAHGPGTVWLTRAAPRPRPRRRRRPALGRPFPLPADPVACVLVGGG